MTALPIYAHFLMVEFVSDAKRFLAAFAMTKDRLLGERFLGGGGLFGLIWGFEYVGTVEGVALGGEEAGVVDDAAKLFFVGAATDSGGIDYVFFDENAADIISAELQADLADFDTRREPTGLNVVDVVEIKAADRESFEVVDGGGFLHALA